MSDYRMEVWNPSMNLAEFYNECGKRGFVNNASQYALIDTFRRERDFQAWILFYNNQPIGSAVAHTLDIFDKPSFRICARTCVLTDQTPISHLRTLRKTIQQHQNHTAQFFIPACIEWAGKHAEMYITSCNQDVASQRLVHRVFMPTLSAQGTVDFVGDVVYRNQKQSFWKVNVDTFYQQLNANPRW